MTAPADADDQLGAGSSRLPERARRWIVVRRIAFVILAAVALGGDYAWFHIARSIHSGEGLMRGLGLSSKPHFFVAVFAATAAACGLVALGFWQLPGRQILRRASLGTGIVAFAPLVALIGITLITHLGMQPFILAAAGAWGSVFVVSGQNYVRAQDINGFILIAVGAMLISSPLAAVVVTTAVEVASAA